MSKIIIGILILISLLGFCFLPTYPDTALWKNIDAFATALTLILVIFESFKTFRQFDTITIEFYINSLNKSIQIDESIVRKDFCRSELQGLIGNQLIKGVTRYNIDYLGTKEYLTDVNKIQTKSQKLLSIKLEDDEIGQFSDIIVPILTEDEISKVKKDIISFIELANESMVKKVKLETQKKLKYEKSSSSDSSNKNTAIEQKLDLILSKI